MKTGWEVRGDKKLLLKLSLMENKVRGPIIRKALRNAAKIVKEKAKKNAPKQSGQLRRQIKVKSMKRKVGRIGVTCILAANEAQEWYANVVEFGRTKRAPFEGRRFLTAAFKETNEQCRELIRAEIWNGILGVLV